MKFEQALEAMRNGKHVKREHWNQPEPATLLIVSMPQGKAIAISPCEGVFSTWLPGHSDLLAEDWQVVESSNLAGCGEQQWITKHSVAHSKRSKQDRKFHEQDGTEKVCSCSSSKAVTILPSSKGMASGNRSVSQLSEMPSL